MADPMTPDRLRRCTEVLHWSLRTLAEVLGCDDRRVRRWASGSQEIPPAVADWLNARAKHAEATPPPARWTADRVG